MTASSETLPARAARPRTRRVLTRRVLTPGRGPLRLGGMLPAALVFVAAFAARIGTIYAGGGTLAGGPSYDAGVYYAAADSLIHGRMPYQDFTLVHPPGIMLALTPFALLGRLTTDHDGFVVATVFWMVLGAVNALLVLRIGRRLQLGTVASLIGALFYAVWYESARSEFTLRLEPLGNALMLLGILAFVRSEQSRRPAVSVGCGAALAAATSVKIWYAVPLVVVLGWHVVDHRRRAQLGQAAAGALATLVAVNGPFFLHAPGRMWQMVVTGQFGRTYSGGSPLRRLATIASSGRVGSHTHLLGAITSVVVGAAMLGGVCVLAWRSRVGRLPVTLVLIELVLLTLTPTFFLYYPDFLAPVLALTAAAAASWALRRLTDRARPATPRRRRLLLTAAWLPLGAVAVLAVVVNVGWPMDAVTPAAPRAVVASVAGLRCVQSDNPVALIELDVLSRDLEHHCPQWVDVIGRTYSPPLRPVGRVQTRPEALLVSAPWQRAIQQYLLAGDAFVVSEPTNAGIAVATLESLGGRPLLARGGIYVVRRG